MGITIIVLGLVCIGLLLKLWVLKREIRNIARELKENRQEEYNKQIRVQLMDRDLTALANECNYNLDYQTVCKRKFRHQEQISRQAISDIAHDLRTPLTVVKGNLQLIQREGNINNKECQYLQICEAKTDELKYMVDEFFELSMLEHDEAQVELTDVNITSLLLDVVLEHEILIREHGLHPVMEIPDKTLFIQGNPQMLERILENLMGNILKYAMDSFTIRLKELEQECVIEFANPIQEAERIDTEHLFDRTYMADGSRNQPGTGLGLYIVKVLAGKQNAEVTARLERNTLIIIIKLKKAENK